MQTDQRPAGEVTVADRRRAVIEAFNVVEMSDGTTIVEQVDIERAADGSKGDRDRGHQ